MKFVILLVCKRFLSHTVRPNAKELRTNGIFKWPKEIRTRCEEIEIKSELGEVRENLTSWLWKSENLLEKMIWKSCYLVVQSAFSMDKGQFFNSHQVLAIHAKPEKIKTFLASPHWEPLSFRRLQWPSRLKFKLFHSTRGGLEGTKSCARM